MKITQFIIKNIENTPNDRENMIHEFFGNKKLNQIDNQAARWLQSLNSGERRDLKQALEEIEHHPLYTKHSGEDSVNTFGWMRGIFFKLETAIRGRWYLWFHLIQQGQLPNFNMDVSTNFVINHNTNYSSAYRVLKECETILHQRGYKGTDFIEWLGYALGISWFQKPEIDHRTQIELYNTFDPFPFLAEPGDYLSEFLSENGMEGINDYYPTPSPVSQLMNTMVNMDKSTTNTSIYEPCLGVGAMFLPSNSLNMCGTEYNLTMVKAASVQAFFYLPWLLYTPSPIVGLHTTKDVPTINKYFEFDTDTRIYWGNSLIGEFTAPKNIFDEESEHVNIYLNALDLEKRSIFKYEDTLSKCEWNELDRQTKYEIVKAQAREITFDVVLTNPPFGKIDAFTKQQIHMIQKKNQDFLKAREKQIAEPLSIHQVITKKVENDIELALNESGQYMLFSS